MRACGGAGPRELRVGRGSGPGGEVRAGLGRRQRRGTPVDVSDGASGAATGGRRRRRVGGAACGRGCVDGFGALGGGAAGQWEAGRRRGGAVGDGAGQRTAAAQWAATGRDREEKSARVKMNRAPVPAVLSSIDAICTSKMATRSIRCLT
eukprot:XP_020407927.1 spidroin-1-like [Zea mays]